MQLEDIFRTAVETLERDGRPFAVAGGLACSLYREEPRLTMDVDLALASQSGLSDARAWIDSLALDLTEFREADLAGGPLFAIKKKNTPVCMVAGRKKDEHRYGVDFLLSQIPWVDDAVARAQHHRKDFGFGFVPTLTLEDVIISKLYALKSASPRFKDLDDLDSIYANEPDVDLGYLGGQIQKFDLKFSLSMRKQLPASLAAVLKSL